MSLLSKSKLICHGSLCLVLAASACTSNTGESSESEPEAAQAAQSQPEPDDENTQSNTAPGDETSPAAEATQVGDDSQAEGSSGLLNTEEGRERLLRQHGSHQDSEGSMQLRLQGPSGYQQSAPSLLNR